MAASCSSTSRRAAPRSVSPIGVLNWTPARENWNAKRDTGIPPMASAAVTYTERWMS